MDYNLGNNFQNIFEPLKPKYYEEKPNPNITGLNDNKIYNFNYNNNDKELNRINNNNYNFDTNNIFGLNFHQDEENDENQIINSLHFSKFNMNSHNYINENENENENDINNNHIKY